MNKILHLLLPLFFLASSANAQESDVWSKPLANMEQLQSYRLEAKSVGLQGSTEAGEGEGTFARARLTKVACQGASLMRLEEQEFRDPEFTKRSSKALQVYDGDYVYLDFKSNERNQKIREDMRPWVTAGQPFQGDFPGWGGCFSDKQDYRGMVKAFAELPGWEAGDKISVNGRLCQTYVNTVPENDPPYRYRVYLDSEGWLRGLDTYSAEGSPDRPMIVYRIRYLNLEINPTLPPATFQVADPQSYRLW